jgi:hypothetical protein
MLNKNWYRIVFAQIKEKYKKPYKIVKIINDTDVPIESLKDKRIEAYTAEQARYLFKKQFAWLNDFLVTGGQIEARIDNDLIAQREAIKKRQEEKNQAAFENAWWRDKD